MKPTVEQLENLLALRRDDRPEEGYWQGFLCDFHRRQREEAARKSGIAGLMSRVGSWFSELGPAKWAYGAGVAYAALTLTFFLIPRGVEVEGPAPTPVSRPVVPAPKPALEQLEQLDLSPSTQGSAGEQVF